VGEFGPAFAALSEALRLHRESSEPERIELTAVNIARLYAEAGDAAKALELLETLTPTSDAEVARALAYDALSDKVSARRAIAKALSLLADSHNEASRVEALEVPESN
jgi:tetratricopeptide (TPR) repeat protein